VTQNLKITPPAVLILCYKFFDIIIFIAQYKSYILYIFSSQMSIPEEGKKTSTHQVVNVTYDTDAMRKFMILNVVLSLILMSTVIYMASVVCGQT
jgi:hypothetical protein